MHSEEHWDWLEGIAQQSEQALIELTEKAVTEYSAWPLWVVSGVCRSQSDVQDTVYFNTHTALAAR